MSIIEKTAQNMADFLIENGRDREDREIYVYGMECLLNHLIAIIGILLISLLLGKLPEAFVWIQAFMSVRNHTGGIHASCYRVCLVGSIAVGTVSVGMAEYMLKLPLYPAWFMAMFFCALIFAWRYAPAPSAKNPMSESMKKRERMLAMRNIIGEGLLMVILLWCVPSMAAIVTLGVFEAVLMVFPVIIKEHHRKAS